MTLSLGLTPEARADLLEARDWYHAQRPGWGEVFERSVEACFARIRRTPGAFTTVHGEVRCAGSVASRTGSSTGSRTSRSWCSRSGTAAGTLGVGKGGCEVLRFAAERRGGGGRVSGRSASTETPLLPVFLFARFGG